MHGAPILEVQDDIALAWVGMRLQDALLEQVAHEHGVGDEAIEALLEVAQSDVLVLFKHRKPEGVFKAVGDDMNRPAVSVARQ